MNRNDMKLNIYLKFNQSLNQGECIFHTGRYFLHIWFWRSKNNFKSIKFLVMILQIIYNPLIH